MKFHKLALLALCLLLSAPLLGQPDPARIVNLTFVDAPVIDVVRGLAEAMGYKLTSYRGAEGKVTVLFRDVPAGPALRQFLSDRGMRSTVCNGNELRVESVPLLLADFRGPPKSGKNLRP